MVDLTRLTDQEILTLTLIGESRGEPIEGQVAVACVIRNRVLTQRRSFREICLQPFQFSCWNDKDPNRMLLEDIGSQMLRGDALEPPSYVQCLCVARGVIRHEIIDNTRGSLNYMTSVLFNSSHKPAWAKDVYFAVTHGDHTFFKIKDSIKV